MAKHNSRVTYTIVASDGFSLRPTKVAILHHQFDQFNPIHIFGMGKARAYPPAPACFVRGSDGSIVAVHCGSVTSHAPTRRRWFWRQRESFVQYVASFLGRSAIP